MVNRGGASIENRGGVRLEHETTDVARRVK